MAEVYETVQFAWGGLLNAKPLHYIHLLSRPASRTLCGKALFADGGPGWSRNGGVSDPEARPCPECVLARDPEVPVTTISTFRELFA